MSTQRGGEVMNKRPKRDNVWMVEDDASIAVESVIRHDLHMPDEADRFAACVKSPIPDTISVEQVNVLVNILKEVKAISTEQLRVQRDALDTQYKNVNDVRLKYEMQQQELQQELRKDREELQKLLKDREELQKLPRKDREELQQLRKDREELQQLRKDLEELQQLRKDREELQKLLKDREELQKLLLKELKELKDREELQKRSEKMTQDDDVDIDVHDVKKIKADFDYLLSTSKFLVDIVQLMAVNKYAKKELNDLIDSYLTSTGSPRNLLLLLHSDKVYSTVVKKMCCELFKSLLPRIKEREAAMKLQMAKQAKFVATKEAKEAAQTNAKKVV